MDLVILLLISVRLAMVIADGRALPREEHVDFPLPRQEAKAETQFPPSLSMLTLRVDRPQVPPWPLTFEIHERIGRNSDSPFEPDLRWRVLHSPKDDLIDDRR